MIQAVAIFMLCTMSGMNCKMENARVTSYVPEFGGHNCAEPCHLTAFMEPINYGQTLACGPNIPYGTDVYIDGWGWGQCLDRGGAITDSRIDIAMKPEDEGHFIHGDLNVVWVLDQ